MNHVRSNSLGLKYQKFTLSCFNYEEIEYLNLWQVLLNLFIISHFFKILYTTRF